MYVLFAALLSLPIHPTSNPNFCIDIPNGAISNGVKLQLYKCNGTAAQDFSAGDVKVQVPTPTQTPTVSNTSLVDAATPKKAGYHVAFSDEFGSTNLDLTKWNLACDGSGGGNNELQYYLPFPANHFLSNGNLTIRVLKGGFLGQQYTSAKLTTQGIFDFTYGWIEARIKVPQGQGLWPAFWTLPKDMLYGQWPTSGEIDIMEILGGEPGKLYGTIHYGPAWPNQKQLSQLKTATPGTDYSQDFHVYAADWQPDHVDFYLDGVKYFTVNASDTQWYTDSQGAVPSTGPNGWPLNIPHYLLLNMAMGGQWPGAPDPSISQGDLVVDYVRVYQQD